jgi:alpha-tubulin suppressor-like RCC1 family protein
MTRKGVWNLQQVRDKYLQTLWDNSPQLFAWGYNNYGTLGQNDRDYRSSPVQISGDWTSFSGTSNTTNSLHGIKGDGTLWAWGRNNASGNLGLNDIISRSSPTQVGSDATWAKVCSSNYNAMATKTDGTLWMWGDNLSGALGLNQAHTLKISSPVQIPGTTWATGFAGRQFTMAKKTDGTLWAWGSASYGNLAQNDKTSRSSPVQIPGTWNSIGIGWFGCTASKTDGTLWSWGYGNHGNLGQGQHNVSYSSPAQIPGTSWNQATMNFYTALATRTDGTLLSWGYNNAGSSGLLGQNQGGPTVASTSSPKQVPGTTWNKIEVGNSKMIATKTDGTLWTWGRNIYGSLGLGEENSPAYISSPTQIGSDSTWTSISNSYFGGYGGKSPLTPSQL